MKSINDVVLEDLCCPIGCKRNDEPVLRGRDLIHQLPGEYTIVRCGTCGLMRTNPRPNPKSIGFYYPDDYGPYVNTIARHQSPRSYSWLATNLRRFFNSNTKKLPKISPGRMLEVGCASGLYLNQMSQKGWQVEGIEFSPKASSEARKLGLTVHTCSLEDAPQPHEKYDLVVAWMVVEHLHQPVLAMKKLSDWVTPQGYLVISIPNCASLEFDMFKHNWYALQLPNHLYHFTPESIRKTLEAAGWKIEKIYHHRVLTNLIASLGYTFRDMGWEKVGNKLLSLTENSGVINRILFPLACLFAMFGQTGRMTVWAKVDNG